MSEDAISSMIPMDPPYEPRPTGQDAASRVYFVQVGNDGPIKVGVTSQSTVQARIHDLQCANPWPLNLLGSIPGGWDLEAAFHRKFARYHMSGEWFAPAPDVLNQVAAALEGTFSTLVDAPAGPLMPLRRSRPSAISLPFRLMRQIKIAAARAGVSPQELVVDIVLDAFPCAEPVECRQPSSVPTPVNGLLGHGA